MRRTTDERIERLCGHHEVADFDCGDESLNRELRLFHERFEEGHRVLGFVAVEDPYAVVAYIILLDLVMRHPESGKEIRCFIVSAMAVASSHQGSRLFVLLRERALEAMAARQQDARAAGAPYKGLICMPGDNKALERWLIGWAGFKPFGIEGLLWLELNRDDEGEPGEGDAPEEND